MVIWIAALALCLGACACAAAEDGAAEPDEWTVMIYLCGLDLETRYGYAIGNLKELAQVKYPINYQYIYMGQDMPEISPENTIGKVNILIEIGGSKNWKGIDYEKMEISPDRLERWTYHYHPNEYAASKEMTMYRAMDILEMPLPAGTYYLEIEVVDMFMRATRLERIQIYWDGEKITYPADFTWEGTTTL